MPLDRALFDSGLKLQSVINLADCAVTLPPRVSEYRQLIVLGHAGPGFFELAAHRKQNFDADQDPLDNLAVELFEVFMSRIDCRAFEVLFPCHHDEIDLRSLGRQLGWQHDSRLGIGIHPVWGTWFAYRLVAAADTDLPVTMEAQGPSPCEPSPCEECVERPCQSACPVSATGVLFQLDACSGERVRAGSDCADRCRAREVCPVGREHQYSRAQIEYHYRHSLHVIRKN